MRIGEHMTEKMIYMLNKVLRREKWRPLIVCGGYSLMALICLIDYSTGYVTRISGLYIFPIILIAIAADWPNAIFSVAIATLIKGVSDLKLEGTIGIAVWNSMLTLFTYSILVTLLIRFRDKTDREQKIAITDTLTGLYNLAGFNEIAGWELVQSKRYNRTFSLIYFDCDKFKRINDTFGHSVGDELLQTVGGVLKAELREADYSFRWGGDEFVVLLPNTAQEGAAYTAEKIREHLSEAMEANQWSVTFSMGVATFSTHPLNLDEMLGQADRLMYAVKNEGGDGVRYATY